MTAPAILARPVRPIPPGLLWHAGCHCPGCGQRQWWVGRATADCAVCATALIIALETTEGDHQWLAA